MRNPRKQALRDAIKSVLFVAAILTVSMVGMCSSPSSVKEASAAQVSASTNAAQIVAHVATARMDQTDEQLLIRRSTAESQKVKQPTKAQKELARLEKLRKKSLKKKKWLGSTTEWRKLAKLTLRKAGCSKTEIDQMMYIHKHEGGPNSINHGGPYYGGWQMDWGKVDSIPQHAWWDPVLSTKRALKYVQKSPKYGSVAAAYRTKKATGAY